MTNTGNCEWGEAPSPLLDGVIVQGFSDYSGCPVKRSNSGCWTSAKFIIGVQLAEKFAFFGVCSNLISYLTGPLGQSIATSAKILNTWSGVSSFLPLLGAFVADSFLGRYNTIIITSLFYVMALGLLSLSAELSTMPQFQVTLFFVSIYLMAFAQGGHTPCVQAFGADQFDGTDLEEGKAKSSFFNWGYFGVCASIGLSNMSLSYVQEYLSWSLGFGIACISMVIATVFFLSGTQTYRFSVKSTDENPFLRIGRVYIQAAKNWRISVVAIFTKVEAEESLTNQSYEQFKYWQNALLVNTNEEHGESYFTDVEDAKAFQRLVPIWLSCLIYAVVSGQISTFFTEQGKTMDRTIWSGFEIPSASLQVFINISIVVCIPLYDRIFVPLTRALTGNQSGITTLQRIGAGILISVTIMTVAALIETKRLKIAFDNGLVNFPETTVPMSVFWLVPQYLLFGISDVFTIVGLQEFFYNEVASDMKSLGLALYLSVSGAGKFLSVFIIYIVEKVTGRDSGWLCDNLNQAHLDYYYWLLAGLSVAGLVMFIYFAKSYKYRQ